MRDNLEVDEIIDVDQSNVTVNIESIVNDYNNSFEWLDAQDINELVRKSETEFSSIDSLIKQFNNNPTKHNRKVKSKNPTDFSVFDELAKLDENLSEISASIEKTIIDFEEPMEELETLINEYLTNRV
jgi:vacuolar-type H+-ATPase subunit I/STV1